ncbi:hypothetical protein PENSPDRAFT_589789 [Peniophora sp. CONT]|nr:hypothetical protein PENSPDRAFT_589789 [Peniophora sp. CONT]
MRSRSVRRPGTAGAEAAPPVPVPHTQTREPGFQVTSRQPHQGHTPHLSQSENRLQAFQQRVYVFDMQRFHMVELGANTRAQDVLAALETQGVLDGWAGAGGWALCEVAQDLGMERPLRPFESVNDVLKSWDKGQMKNVFLAKKCALADTLSARNLPSALPRRGAYVDYEVKRGSWKKRWLELREQGLWLAKKDTGKDEVFLCSISSFDAYTVTRPAKSPKPFTFAVKSTDNLTFFENVADYVHVFSCGEGDGKQWIEKIMLGRSYIMNQERNVIASAAGQPPTPGLLAGGSGALKRSGTRKREVPAQPLIDVSPPAAVVAAAQAPVFEPGSLLARR